MVSSNMGLIDAFHELHYRKVIENFPKFLGVTVEKTPFDLWVYQELIFESKPSFIVETGTRHGGSALFFSSICDMVSHGSVVTIDTEDMNDVTHSRLTKLIGNSVSDEMVAEVRKVVGCQSTLVTLDSNHTKDHVLKEMALYSPFVHVGGYMVVEDTNIHGHPILPDWGEGPMEAVEEFLDNRDDFVIDRDREKFLVSFAPCGFLTRVHD